MTLRADELWLEQEGVERPQPRLMRDDVFVVVLRCCEVCLRDAIWLDWDGDGIEIVPV